MKISLNWIKEYTEVHLKTDELLERIGSRLGAIEEVVNLEERYAGIVVAKVITSEKHPDADKLHVCTIDDGGAVKDVPRDAQGHIQVVCGAPNVEAGMLAAWIPPGAVVPSTFDKDPFKVEAKEIRGILSQGMLASPSELAISDNHEGLLSLDQDAKPGVAFAVMAKLNDQIIDIENKMFTHRPDCFGILGVAREIAGIQNIPFTSPAWYKKVPDDAFTCVEETLPLSVDNQMPDQVPRFAAIALGNVKIAPSPLWLQTLLSRLGMRPINDIVDITNYMMLLTAQPLHAYDYDKVTSKDSGAKQATLTIRPPKAGEKLTILGGKEVLPSPKTIVIATADSAIGLGGVMGGADTEVDANTKNIILECANFDMYTVRNTAMTLGLFTDAATRFTKGQSPLQIDKVLAQAVKMVKELAGGVVASKLQDKHGQLPDPARLSVGVDFINSRLGFEPALAGDEIANLLSNVELEYSPASYENLDIRAPFWRTDIEIPEDIVEEVGRLYGYEHLPLALPQKDLTPAPVNGLLAFKSKIRDVLAKAGANEVLTYSFVPDSLMQNVGQDSKNAYHIRNAISPDLQYYRLSLAPSLLEKVHPNIKARYDEFALFEIGKGHIRGVMDAEGLPEELELLSLVFASKNKAAGAAFYRAKKFCSYLLDMLSIPNISYRSLSQESLSKEQQSAAAPYDPNRSALIFSGDKLFGIIGEPTIPLRNKIKLPAQVAQFELDVKVLAEVSSDTGLYIPPNRYPSLDQDLCLRTSVDTPYAKLTDFLCKQLREAVKDHGYTFEVTPVDIFQKVDNKDHKQTTWHITVAHPERTLTTEETNKLLDTVASVAKTELNAERI
jgi:phenylalanyl-tRNA synthetase beta chain